MPLHIAIAQINPTVGDLPGNARLIVEAARAAHAQGAQLLLTPELAVCGYPSHCRSRSHAARIVSRDTQKLTRTYL